MVRAATSLVLGLVISAGVAEAEKAVLPVAHWVWNRTQPLGAAEVETLAGTGCAELFWNLGTLEREGNGWRGVESLSMPASPENIRFIPVVRLHPSAATMEEPAADASLAALLTTVCRRFRAEELQLDFDCPDRLLSRYAAVLGRVRESIRPVRLSATALAQWPRLPGFPELCRNVDSLAPMFYDLETDAPPVNEELNPAPLADPARLRRQIAGWKDCPVAWRAGLPNFARVSLVGANGRARGQLEAWRWEALALHPALAVEKPTVMGATVLRAGKDMTLEKTPLRKGERLIVRWPDLAALREAAAAAGESGARGLLFFKLPAPRSPSGWSLETLNTALHEDAAPRFELVLEEARLVLRNASGMDLPPRFASSADATDAGWLIELELTPASVLDLAAGEFAFRDSEMEKQTGRVCLRFTSLRARGMIGSGFFQCLTHPSSLRWRIPEISDAWQDAVPPSR